MRWRRFGRLTHGTGLLVAGAPAAGTHGERLWLAGGLVVALGAVGAVARAATRAHRDGR